MEIVVGVDGNDEGKVEDSGVEKFSYSLSSPKQFADPVVYKLVRVEGDGRLVPATDDEIMEVEDFLVDDKTEIQVATDTEKTVECISIEGSACGKLQLEDSDGLSPAENLYSDMEKSTSQMENISKCIKQMLHKVKQEERFYLACGSSDDSSAFMHVESLCSDQLDILVPSDEKLQSEITLQDTIPSSAPSLNDNHVSLTGSAGECSKPPDGPAESTPSASVDCSSSKPDFLKGEICLDNLSIRELHELFRATFGRETTVKDKFWLKKRIAMGLTNSCDVATTTFVIRNNKLIKNEKLVEKGKERFNDEGDVVAMGSAAKVTNVSCKTLPISNYSQIENHQTNTHQRSRNSSMDFDYQSEDPHTEQRAAKRIRKPTKRYIEELSEFESEDYTQKVFKSTQNSGLGQTQTKSYPRPVRSECSNERTMVMRLDSLGGSGVKIPFVSRARRCRPRKNVTSLLKFHPTNEGITAGGVKEAVASPSFLPDNENVENTTKAKYSYEHMHPLLTTKVEKDKWSSVAGTIILGKNLGSKLADSSEDTSDDNIVTALTTKGGMRRKHHRAWTLAEVMKLVEGVSKCGAGRWSEIKRLAFASYSYRTSVDLKDKWRNLLKASFSQTLPDDGINSRKNSSVPIPASILLRVRELAEMHSQVPQNLGSSKLACVSGNSVHKTRLNYL